jgi:hypothetical protein
VDWINSIWYKQERFMNCIRNALKGMTGQLVKWHGKTECFSARFYIERGGGVLLDVNVVHTSPTIQPQIEL